MPDYQSQIDDALQATAFASSCRVLWFGERLYSLPRAILRVWSEQDVRNYLLDSLQSTLYNNFYCLGFAAPRSQQLATSSTAEENEFLRTLSNSNTGVGTWEDGWSVHAVNTDGHLFARKQIVVSIRHEEALPVSNGKFGSSMGLHVKLPKESLYLAPGYYVAFGNAAFIEDSKSEIVRFYFNLRTTAVAHVMRLLTKE